MPLPILPIYVKDIFGIGPIGIGLVIGAQSFATLLTRPFAGRLCDEKGSKRTVLAGFCLAASAGVLYRISAVSAIEPQFGMSILIAGRLILGLGESLFITSLTAWSIVKVGPTHAGRAMAWSGLAMYGAIAAGAPLGSVIADAFGYRAVFWCVVICPLLGLALSVFWKDALVESRPRIPFLQVFCQIWPPGLALALASFGVGTISAFLALRYNVLGWSGVAYALTGFGAAYIAVRLLFAGLPDRIGGTVTAAASLSIEVLGLLIIWLAMSPAEALSGAIITGLGYSLVFPSLGIEAMRRVSHENRGMVIGTFTACFDLGLAGAGPLAGIVASSFSLPAVFMVAAFSALAALFLTSISRHR